MRTVAARIPCFVAIALRSPAQTGRWTITARPRSQAAPKGLSAVSPLGPAARARARWRPAAAR
jgi:hypothetical protein